MPLLPHHSVGYGLALHNAIRDFYVHAREGWPVDEERLVRLFERVVDGRGLHHARARGAARSSAAARRSARFVRARAGGSRRSPRAVEGEFRFERGRDVVRGRFDRVDVRREGPVIVDFKSSDVDRPGEGRRSARRTACSCKLYALA